MLNSNLLKFDANGAILTQIGVAIFDFNGGCPMARDTGRLLVGGPAQFFNNGIGYSGLGNMSIEDVKPPVAWSGGLPLSDAGHLCITEGGTAAYYTNGGIPIDATGRVPINSGTTPVLNAFSDGFSDGFGA